MVTLAKGGHPKTRSLTGVLTPVSPRGSTFLNLAGGNSVDAYGAQALMEK